MFSLHTPIKTGDDPRCSCDKECGNRIGKHPRWHEYDLPNGVKNATTDEKQIIKWWNRWPLANIGIASGRHSFDALDVDVKPEVDGNETLYGLEQGHGNLPDTVEQIPGGGGRHLLFKYSGKMSNRVKFAPGLDTRSDGGYIVAPPSLHKSANYYKWELSSRPDEVELAEAPGWLLNLIQKASVNENGSTTPDIDFSVGCHDSTLFSIAWHLAKGGMAEANVLQTVRFIAQNLDPNNPTDHWARTKVRSAFNRLENNKNGNQGNDTKWKITIS